MVKGKRLKKKEKNRSVRPIRWGQVSFMLMAEVEYFPQGSKMSRLFYLFVILARYFYQPSSKFFFFLIKK